MILWVFATSAGTAIFTYVLILARLERHDAPVALRRLVAKPSPRLESSRRVRPLLITAVDEMRGRLAGWILDRLRLKEAAERKLETAALKWGAAGLLHRSVTLFLVSFAGVTFFT